MAKLADAADLKSAGRKAVGVQVPLRAPIKSKSCGHPNEKQGCRQASAATILVILPTAGSQRAVLFRRCSLPVMISLISPTGRISKMLPYLSAGC